MALKAREPQILFNSHNRLSASRLNETNTKIVKTMGCLAHTRTFTSFASIQGYITQKLMFKEHTYYNYGKCLNRNLGDWVAKLALPPE